MATTGVISKAPIEGITRRSGERIGSVISWRIDTIGLLGLRGNQEKIALSKIAMVSSWHRTKMKREIASIRLVSSFDNPQNSLCSSSFQGILPQKVKRCH